MNFEMINAAVAEHYEARDLAIRKLVSMYEDDYDIEDPEVLESVMARYGLLNDGFESEARYILLKVKETLHI